MLSLDYAEPGHLYRFLIAMYILPYGANRLTKKTALYIFARTELAHSFFMVAKVSWKTKNPEKVREQLKRYYQKNRDHIRQKNKDWKLRNPEKRAKQRVCEKERYHDRHNPY